MSSVQIVVGDSLVLTSELVSPIWLEIDGVAFPYADWNDFSYTLLCWWSDALFSYTDSTKSFEWLFMDGPYRIAIRRSGDGLQLSCMRDDRRLLTGECDYRTLAEALHGAMRQMEYLLHKNGLDQGDTAWMSQEIHARTARMRKLL